MEVKIIFVAAIAIVLASDTVPFNGGILFPSLNVERKEPFSQTLQQDMSSSTKEMENLPHLLLSNIPQFEDLKTSGVKKIIERIQDFTQMYDGSKGEPPHQQYYNYSNYIYGVQHSDDFPFELIVEAKEIKERHGTDDSQAIDITSHINVFTLYHQKGFRIRYSLIIIDTPRFSDTRDIEKTCGSSEIICIGMVMHASQARITTEPKYIVDSAFQLFSNDIADNIVVFFTFADVQPPPIPHAKEKYNKYKTFALYAQDDFFWKFCFKNLKKLFNDLIHTDSKNLNLTKKSLEKRQKLRKNKTQIKIEVEDPEDASHSVTNCYVCYNTCHDSCCIVGDLKQSFVVIGAEGNFGVCPQKCHWEKRRNGTCQYNRLFQTKEVTADDILKKCKISIKENSKKETLIKLFDDYQNLETMVINLHKEANECFNRLDEIALRPSFLNIVQYIDRLIKTEEKRTKDGKGQRLQQLSSMRDVAQLFHECSTSSIDNNEQEEEIKRIMLHTLDGIDDDKDFQEAKETS